MCIKYSFSPPMATIAFLTLLTLTLSSTIHARESQFFNKFSTNIPNESQPSNTNQQQQQPLNTNQQQQQQQPEFIPQSQDSDSYGLYGHQSGQLPPSTTTNNNLPDYLPENYNPVAYTTPIHSSTQDIPNNFKDPQTNQLYNPQNQGFDGASFMETEQDGDNMYNQGRYGTRGNGNMYNPEKQGMSDTRFLDNGKYYYDVNMENLNSNENINTRGYGGRRNEYNTQGYYGNNNNYNYNNNNNQNSYDRYNSNGGYYGNNQNSYDRYSFNGGDNQNSYERYNFNGGYHNQDQYRFNP